MSDGAPALCRDCGAGFRAADRAAPGRCPACGSRRTLSHGELDALTIAHLDCDAFYAAVEKRDDPSLVDKPVLIGGGKRGVVSAACYVARRYGCRSAMPMFKALALCPGAVVIRPDMAKYQAVGREVRALMQATTPLVEPLSIDEAFLDLGGTERLHRGSAARTLALLVRRIEQEIGITASIGLSYNKFLAKLASDLDKPRGFSVIGRAEAPAFLATLPVTAIWGVGASLTGRLARDGIRTVGQLQEMGERDLVARYGSIGTRLARFSHGLDDRRVEPAVRAKSVSAETTFERDLADPAALRPILWRLAEEVAGRLKRAGLAGRTVTLKLKTREFRLLTRRRALASPTRLAETIYRGALPLLEQEADGRLFRLIGVGVSDIAAATDADAPDLLDPEGARRERVEQAIDRVREKLGDAAVIKGRALEPGAVTAQQRGRGSPSMRSSRTSTTKVP